MLGFKAMAECSSPSQSNMVTCESQAPHQHYKAQNSSDCSATLDPPSARTPNQDAVRKCHGCGLNQPLRGRQESRSLEESKPDNFIDRNSLSSNLRGPHSRSGQLESYCMDHGEWALHQDIFNLISQKWGTPDSTANHLCL